MHSCKGFCLLGKLMAIHNIKTKDAYAYANRCTQCSDGGGASIWYLKRVIMCPCCGNMLRRKSKHSKGRQEITKILKERENDSN